MSKVQKSIMHDTVREGNRIAIPSMVLQSLELKSGDPIKLVVENGTITITKRVTP
ncbi:hypothetical protein D3C73_687950 [compost metagenome]